MKSWIQRNWGGAWIALVALVSVATLLRQGESGHFEIFSYAGRLVWEGGNPYLKEFNSGMFVYSPACALFFYGPFSFFPHSVGLALYMGFSLAVFFAGLAFFLRQAPLGARTRNVLLFLISSELIGTILNARFEIFTLGIWLGCAGWILAGTRPWLSYFLLGMVSNFKLQTLPVAGLLLLVETVGRRRVQPVIAYLASLAFWAVAPLVRYSPAELISLTASMKRNLDAYLQNAWLSFQHVLAFVHKTTGLTPTWAQGQIVLAVVALTLALVVASDAWRARDARPSGETSALALALGAGFSTAFLPMSQSAAYVLYLPLLWMGLRQIEREPARRRRWILGSVVFAAFFLVSLAYSDLTPRPARLWIFAHAFKAVGVLVLMISVLVQSRRVRAALGSRDEGCAST